jgi:hypothetical protein
MPINQIKGGTHHHYYNLTQAELDLETKKECTFRAAPKLLEHIEKRAKLSGLSRSKFIETTLIKFFKSEPEIKKLYTILDNVIDKNF